MAQVQTLAEIIAKMDVDASAEKAEVNTAELAEFIVKLNAWATQENPPVVEKAVASVVKGFDFYNAIHDDMRKKVNAFVSQEGFDPNGKEYLGSYFYSIVDSVSEGWEFDKYVTYRVNLILRLREMGGVVPKDALEACQSLRNWADYYYEIRKLNYQEYLEYVDVCEDVCSALVDNLSEFK